jgi:hypothetical protein
MYLATFFSMATKKSRWNPNPAGSVSNWPLGSGSVSQDSRSADPHPKEIFTDPSTLIFYAPPAQQDFSSYILLSLKFFSLQTLYKVYVSTCYVPFLPKLSCKLSQFMNILSQVMVSLIEILIFSRLKVVKFLAEGSQKAYLVSLTQRTKIKSVHVVT